MKKLRDYLRDAEAKYITRALAEFGTHTRAAEELGISVATLYRKLPPPNEEKRKKMAARLRKQLEKLEPENPPEKALVEEKIPAPAEPQVVQPPTSDTQPFLTAEQLSVALNLPVSTVKYLTRARRIPYIKIGYRTHIYDLHNCQRSLERFNVSEL